MGSTLRLGRREYSTQELDHAVRTLRGLRPYRLRNLTTQPSGRSTSWDGFRVRRLRQPCRSPRQETPSSVRGRSSMSSRPFESLGLRGRPLKLGAAMRFFPSGTNAERRGESRRGILAPPRWALATIWREASVGTGAWRLDATGPKKIPRSHDNSGTLPQRWGRILARNESGSWPRID
jgi:hypothetical protein